MYITNVSSNWIILVCLAAGCLFIVATNVSVILQRIAAMTPQLLKVLLGTILFILIARGLGA